MNKAIELEGTHYMKDAKGALVPISLIRPADLKAFEDPLRTL
ncbi:hypothetical protein [Bartonella sp. B39]